MQNLSDGNLTNHLAHFHNIASFGQVEFETLVRAFHFHTHDTHTGHIVYLHDQAVGARDMEHRLAHRDGDVLIVKEMVEGEPESLMTLGIAKGETNARLAFYKPMNEIEKIVSGGDGDAI